jgi:hypothetical protein
MNDVKREFKKELSTLDNKAAKGLADLKAAQTTAEGVAEQRNKAFNDLSNKVMKM